MTIRVALKIAYSLILSVSLTPATALAEDSKLIWKKVAEDLETGTTTLAGIAFTSTEITFLRTSLKRFKVGVVRAEEHGRKSSTVKSLCKFSRAVACINANFFDEQGHPLGLVVSRGIQHKKVHSGGNTLTGVFFASRSGIAIINRVDVKDQNILEAVQAGPRLIAHNRPVQGLREKEALSRRSGVCIDNRSRMIWYVVSSGIFGVSPAKLQKLLSSTDISCKDALNLDGGGSSQFYLAADLLPGAPNDLASLDIPGTDEVPVALGLFLRKPA